MPDRLSAATRRTTARATAAVALAVGLAAVTTGCTAPGAAISAESAGPSYWAATAPMAREMGMA